MDNNKNMLIFNSTQFSLLLMVPSLSALQRHYAILEAFALGEDDTDLPDPKDDTMPPEEQMEKYAEMSSMSLEIYKQETN